MITRSIFLVSGVLAVALVGAAACGDDETTNSTTSTTTNSTGGSGGGAITCEMGCSVIYDCGLDGMPQNCPAFTAADKADFITGCIPGCEANPALLGLPMDDCATLVGTVSSLNADFKCSCENGVGAAVCDGGAGGTGGSSAGGAGGAGGN